MAPSGPPELRLSVSPQPFRTSATLSFTLPSAGRVRLTIHDVGGRRVAALADGAGFAAGTHSLAWDGLTSGGEPAPTGVYFARITTPGSGSLTVKVLRVH